MISENLEKLFDQIRVRSEQMDNPNLDDWMDEVRRYLDVGKSVGKSLNFEQPSTIRQAQKALSFMEARLDRIIAMHHDAKRVLQILASIEFQLIGMMTREKYLPGKATGPAQQQAIATTVPELLQVKSRWEALDIVCTQAQRRIASAKESIKLQSSLDDNLRWAQYRDPG